MSFWIRSGESHEHPLPSRETSRSAAERLVERLRGTYRLAVNDGAGPLNGSDEFVRQFNTSSIQQAAANRIEQLTSAQAHLAELRKNVIARERLIALRELIIAVEDDVKDRGGNGYLLARLKDAQTALNAKET